MQKRKLPWRKICVEQKGNMKSKSTPLFHTRQSLGVDCSTSVSLKLKNKPHNLVSRRSEHNCNTLAGRCFGFIWTATASSLAFQDPLWSIPKSSFLHFSFSLPACYPFSPALIIPFAHIYSYLLHCS